MSDPLAYFLTWTTYGTWLPGDERGWVDDRLRESQPSLKLAAAGVLKQSPVVFDADQRMLVERTIRGVCDHNGWQLWAMTCRTNHVHVVITANGTTPEKVMNSLKSWCSRRLNELLDQTTERPKWWTRHGSTRYLNDESSLEAAVEYVVSGQERARFDA